MNARQVATTAVTLALGFLLGALTWQPSFAQRKAEEAPKAEQQTVGRYQLFLTFGPGHLDTVYAMETATGQVWVYGDKGWAETAGPVPARKK